jgi:hypothetical protein
VDAFLADLEERRGRKASSVFSIASLVGRESPPGSRTASAPEVPAADAIRASRKQGRS